MPSRALLGLRAKPFLKYFNDVRWASGILSRGAARYGDDLAETAATACSFAGATVVLIADGTKKAIEDVNVGDMVLATDPETGDQAAKEVTVVLVHDDTVTDLVIDGEVISTTEDHPFWSVTDQRFERADELATAEHVLSATGRTVSVSHLMAGTSRTAAVYNLSVEGIHTFHVGQVGVLVHNTCPVGGGPSFIGFTDGPPVAVPAGAKGPVATDGPGIPVPRWLGRSRSQRARYGGPRDGRHRPARSQSRLHEQDRTDSESHFRSDHQQVQSLGTSAMVSRFQIKDLIGLELSAVCYVRDYVELHFDGPILRCLADPIIAGSSGRFEHREVGSRDALCALVGEVVLEATDEGDEATSRVCWACNCFPSRNGHPALDQRSRTLSPHSMAPLMSAEMSIWSSQGP